MNPVARTLPAIALLGAAWLGLAGPARAQALAQTPLFLSPAINPNVLVLLDNSQSMDGTMAGKVISGASAETRSSIARGVLRDVIETYRYTFNWGLGSFGVSGVPALSDIFGYYLGNADTMVYTDTCDAIVDGVGVSDIVGPHSVLVDGVRTVVSGPLPCIANPQPAPGYNYITFDRSGDDADVNDVTYISGAGAQMYGIGDRDTTYLVFGSRTSGTDWYSRNFGASIGRLTFGATDSGWVADAAEWPRRLWVARGWGFNNDITGMGTINEPVVSSQPATAADLLVEAAHYEKLVGTDGTPAQPGLLSAENADPASPSLKNAARYTPLAGTVETSRRYFSGQGYSSPISDTCQKNFVVLATDGNPTGKKDGSQYDPTQWVNTYNATKKEWTYGPAIDDVLKEITKLRSTTKGGDRYDIKTYVIGLGSTVINDSSAASLNEMASQGGTVNAFFADKTDALKSAFASIASAIDAESRSGAAAGLSSGSWQTGAALYQGKFSSVDWSGDLTSTVVASDGSLATTATWSAATQLSGQHWDTGRAIMTYRPVAGAEVGRGIAFRWPADPAAPRRDELNLRQVLALNTGEGDAVDGQGEFRLRYLRGDSAREARNCAVCAPTFRNRPVTVLGDIVGSAPFYVGAPSANFYDDFESAAYSSFVAAWRGRAPQVYVGANDGMLHAFDAATGNETFAYVPNLVFGSLSALSAIPFKHRYNVDGPPAVADVFYDSAWHTLLVAGLRAGGRGVYALDVTDPRRFTEADADSVVRWEFNDPDMGHVYAPPTLVKTNNGRWSVIVGNGYNSPSKRALLFVIDAETGALVRKIAAGSAEANGLSAPAAIDVDGDGIVDVVYAGDLTGKLWKFDLSAASPDDWGLALSGVALFDAGSLMAITSRPDVTRTPKGGYMVTFGTGRYLSAGDPSSTGEQRVYGIWDKNGTVVEATDLQEQVIEAVTATGSDGDIYRTSSHRVDPPTDAKLAIDEPNVTRDAYYANNRGWFLALPAVGERVVADARIRGGRAIFTSIVPDNSNRCVPAGTSWVLEFDVFTGNRLDQPTFNTNTDAALTAADYLVFSSAPDASATNTSGWKIEGFATGAAFMGFKDGNATSEIKYLPTSNGVVVQKREAASGSGDTRVMWRVVQ